MIKKIELQSISHSVQALQLVQNGIATSKIPEDELRRFATQLIFWGYVLTRMATAISAYAK